MVTILTGDAVFTLILRFAWAKWEQPKMQRKTKRAIIPNRVVAAMENDMASRCNGLVGMQQPRNIKQREGNSQPDGLRIGEKNGSHRLYFTITLCSASGIQRSLIVPVLRGMGMLPIGCVLRMVACERQTSNGK